MRNVLSVQEQVCLKSKWKKRRLMNRYRRNYKQLIRERNREIRKMKFRRGNSELKRIEKEIAG